MTTGGIERATRAAASGGPARGLGWFSLALGAAEVAAPGRVARLIGVDGGDRTRNALLALGLREMASGIGILLAERPGGWLWARVGGDTLDLALLGRALASPRSDRTRVAVAAAAVAAVTLLDLMTARDLTRGDGAAADRGIRVRRSVTVERSPEEAYEFWRDLANLPRFMAHLEAVEVLGDRRSRWRARAPAGGTVEWEAEIVEERPGELLAWRSLEGARVPNAGRVLFHPAPGGRGAEVHVDLRYDPPGGRIGAGLAKLLGEEPALQVAGDLRRFKQVLETGEVVRSDASLHPGPHPARPPAVPM